jgi:DNA repair exonuclease SbcCD ATPase subunit
MAVNLNGSSKNAEMEYIDILLEGKSNEFKGRVLAFIRKYKIDANDPTFMLLVAIGGLDVALVDLPQAIAKGQQGLSEEIKRVESEFGEIWQTAISALKAEIEEVKTVHQERDLRSTTKERELDRKLAAVETAISALDANILTLEGIESRIKADYSSLATGLVAYKQELATGLNKLEQRDSIKIWDFDKWRAEHWLLFGGTVFLGLLLCIDLWRTHSELNLVKEKLDRVLTKVDYNATKLGRIEKHLGVKKPKSE